MMASHLIRRRGCHAQSSSGACLVASTQCRHFFGPFKKKDPAPADGSATPPPFPGFPGFKMPTLEEMQKEMEKATADGKAPPKAMQKLTEKNVAGLKTLLNAQQKMTGGLGLGTQSGFGKAFGKNEELLKQMIQLQEVMLKSGKPPGADAPAGGTTTTTSAADPKHVTAGATSSTSTSQGASTKSASTGGGQPTVDLGPETEELFAELRSMREKKNEMKRLYEAKTRTLSAVEADLSESEKVSKDLRERLKKAERDVALLNTEVVDLKEKVRDLKPYKQKVSALEGQVSSLKHQDTAPLQKRIEELEKQIDDKNEGLRSSNRKLERSRKTSPILQLSAHLTDIARASGPLFDSTATDEAFAALQDKYNAQVLAAWETTDAKALGAALPLAAACKDYLTSCLPHARYDAVCTVTGDVAAWSAVMKAAWCLVEPVENSPDRFRILSTAIGSSGLGPYGLVYALMQQASKSTNAKWSVTKCAPFISQKLLNDSKRVTTRVDTCRSNKPGGQAANVGETHIRVNLYIDLELVAVSEAQDSRSAHSNKEAAFTRLFDDKIPAINAKFESSEVPSVSSLRPRGIDAATAESVAPPIPLDRWHSILKSIPLEDPVAEAVVLTVRDATAKP